MQPCLTMWKLYAQADYHTLAALPQAGRGPLDEYLWLRSFIVLGAYEKVDAYLKPLSPLAPFLRWQLAIYRRENLDKLVSQTLEFSEIISAYPLLQADYHFVVSYLFNLLTDHRQGLRHQERALRCYEKAQLPGPMAASLFNLCVGSHNLDERETLDVYLSRLTQLAKDFPYPSVRLHALRFTAYLQGYRENYAQAQETLEEAINVANAANRIRDLGGLNCFLAYVLLRQDKREEFEQHALSISTTSLRWDAIHVNTLREMQDLANLGLPTRPYVEKKMRHWKRTIDAVNFAYLVQILLERIARTKDYELLARVAHRACLTSTRRQQCLALVDYRYYEILGLARSGQRSQATRLLAAYVGDAKDFEAHPRLVRAGGLERELGVVGVEQASNISKPVVTLDILTMELRVESKTIDLRRYPNVAQFILHLIKADGRVTADTLFQSIYGFPYHPFQNGSRLSSLLHRARVLVDGLFEISRDASGIFLDKQFRYVIVEDVATRENVVQRRKRILDLLREANAPLQISELERHFPYSRRTLQLDLTHLTKTKQVHATPGTCKRHYSTQVTQ